MIRSFCMNKCNMKYMGIDILLYPNEAAGLDLCRRLDSHFFLGHPGLVAFWRDRLHQGSLSACLFLMQMVQQSKINHVSYTTSHSKYTQKSSLAIFQGPPPKT